MGFLDSLTPGQKLLGGAAVAGAAYLLLANRGGGGDAGLAVVDVRRPTDDMNTPGAGWGGDGYQYFADSINSYNSLLRHIWGNPQTPVAVPPGTGTPGTPGTPGPPGPPGPPGTPGTPVTPVIPHDGRGTFDSAAQRVADIRQRIAINRGQIADYKVGGVTEQERAAINRERAKNEQLFGKIDRIGELFDPPKRHLGITAPVTDPNAPGPPTPRPFRGEIVR